MVKSLHNPSSSTQSPLKTPVFVFPSQPSPSNDTSDHLLFSLYLDWSIYPYLINVYSFIFTSDLNWFTSWMMLISMRSENRQKLTRFLSSSPKGSSARLSNLSLTERINSVWLDDTGQSPWGMWGTGGRERKEGDRPACYRPEGCFNG